MRPDGLQGSSTLIRVASRPTARLGIGVALGVAFFLLGSAYLSQSEPREVTAVMVVGGERLRAGSPAHLRVQGRTIPGRKAVPITLEGVSFDGAPVPFRQEGEDPARIAFDVPLTTTPKSLVVLQLRAGEERRALPMEIEVLRFTPTSSDVRWVTPVGLPRVATPHRVETRPEHGDLILAMETRVFLRVRAQDGAPIPKAHVHLKHRGLPGGEAQLVTDDDGLADVPLLADQPSIRLGIEASAQGKTTETDALLRPRGRLMLLESERPVVPPGHPVRVTLRTWKPAETVICDLLWEGAWIWSQSVTTRDGVAPIDLGTLEPSRYDLQCSTHAIDPGEAWASIPLFVDERPVMDVLGQAIEAGGHIHPSGTRFKADPPSPRTVAYLTSHLRREVAKPHVHVSTRESEIQAQKAERHRVQTWLLVAMGLLAITVLLFVADLLIGHSLDTRERMRAFAVESLEDGTFDPEDDLMNLRELAQRKSMLRTRGMLLVFVLVGTLALNAAGILAALHLSGG